MSDQNLKKDAGKPRLDLLPPEALIVTAKVLAFGAEKYAPHGWRNGMDWSRLHAAAMRHLLAWSQGEDLDPESGLSHLGHALCCLSFLAAYQERGVGNDDRYKVAPKDVFDPKLAKDQLEALRVATISLLHDIDAKL